MIRARVITISRSPFSAAKRWTVYQGAETDIEMPVIRHAEYVLASGSMGVGECPRIVLAGKFQGGVKLLSEIVQGGKGVTVKFDPETVKGSDDNSKLRIKAASRPRRGAGQAQATTSRAKRLVCSRSMSTRNGERLTDQCPDTVLDSLVGD